jgi:phosphomannomutase
MITASHNPKEYNGFKMIKKSGNNLEMVRGKDLFAGVQESDFKNGENHCGPCSFLFYTGKTPS